MASAHAADCFQISMSGCVLIFIIGRSAELVSIVVDMLGRNPAVTVVLGDRWVPR